MRDTGIKHEIEHPSKWTLWSSNTPSGIRGSEDTYVVQHLLEWRRRHEHPMYQSSARHFRDTYNGQSSSSMGISIDSAIDPTG